MSGHNKWSTIKNKKAKTDAAKGKIFTKIGREIVIAVKTGGSADPALNSKLKDVIAKAKAANMPNDNIQRSIKKAAGEGESTNYKEVTYEGYAPCGVAVIVEIVTDNLNRTASEVRHIFDKCGGSLGASGCVSWKFERKGVIVIDNSKGMDEDELTMLALDAGADDVEYNEDGTGPYIFGGIEGNGDIAVSGGAVNGCVDAGGKLTITGGTITAAVGADEPAISAGGETTISGGSVSGDVMAVDGADVKISGTAAIEGNVQSNGDGTKIGISGGSVNGTLSESNDGDLSVTGGHFSTDPSDYVAEGYYADGDDTNGYDVKERKSLEGAVITVADATYTGSAQAPAPVVKVDEETLELGKDFVAVYATNDLVNADTYDVTIVAIGAWIGSAETTFTIGKKQVVVKAKDLAVAFRTPVADVVYELEYDGIVDGEDPADVVATAPTASSDYAADSPAGSTFDIAVDVTGAAADNYSFVASETKGVLTVGAAEAPTILGTTSITVAQSTVKLQHVLQTGAKYYTYFTCTDLAKGEWVAAENSRAAESIIPETVTDADGVDHEGTTVKFTGVTDDVRFYQVGYSSVPYAIGDAMGEKPADGEEP